MDFKLSDLNKTLENNMTDLKQMSNIELIQPAQATNRFYDKNIIS